MLQIVEQTKEEKMAMYMKLPKKQIAEMLINCNDIITALTQAKNCSIPAVIKSVCPKCHGIGEIQLDTDNRHTCKKCCGTGQTVL